jgi:hypothetical protein
VNARVERGKDEEESDECTVALNPSSIAVEMERSLVILFVD